MRKLFTPGVLEQRAPLSGRIEIRDTLSPLILQISAHNNRVFCVRARVRGQKNPLRLAFQSPAHISVLQEARTWAVTTVNSLRNGDDPRPKKEELAAAVKIDLERLERNRFSSVVANFLKRHVSKNRGSRETKRTFDRYCLPRWRDLQIEQITRSDVVALLDELESRKFVGENGLHYGGPVMADHVLAHLRKLMNWHAARDSHYVSPIVIGMARTRPKERARTRVLKDEEIKLIWPQLDKLGVHGAAIKMLFLTAQRVGEVCQIDRARVDHNGVWEIPAEMYKSKRPQFVPLTEQALKLIDAQTQVDGSTLVFPAEKDARKSVSNLSTMKAELDGLVTDENGGEPIPHWTLHDIRRTCRTLMSRAGIAPHIGERVLGHAIPGVEGVYDRHSYITEKRHALTLLCDLLEGIITPPAIRVIAAE
jgi:integrase